ncbi:MAG: dynamin family protein [Bryobacteraceae bacterium]|nr:dynamin family protein [Bryobacteraceae bacterium]
MQTILRPEQEAWLADVRERLTQLLAILSRSGAAPEDEAGVRNSLRQLDDLFLLVVVGEFNAGKSVFVNALVGEAVLEEGVLPTTTTIQILRYGDAPGRTALDESRQLVEAPVALLRDISIVDTPGTNAIERKHEAITQEFVPRAELVFFVTSADRPFTESERAFMERIRAWGKKIVVVVNKIDILERPEDAERMREFVADNSIRLLGIYPDIFLISAREALRAKQTGGPVPAGFEALERYVVETLDAEERVRLKLLNPLGIGEHVIGKNAARGEAELALLREDLGTIEELESRLEVYKEDMSQGFRLRLADLDNVLRQMEARGRDFIDDTVRVGRVFDLLKRDKVKAEFEKQVVGDVPATVEKRVDAIIDWLISSELQQWQMIRDHLLRRRTELSERAAGDIGGRLEYDRARLIDTLGRTAQRTMESYDQRAEADRMAESVRGAVANAAFIEVGAVGLGALVTVAATSTAADITGVAAASVLAAVGFLVIPHKRRAARNELREKVARLRQQLMSALTSRFEGEIERSLRRMNEGVAPYAQFVRAQRRLLTERLEELAGLRQAMTATRREIERR